MQQETSDRRHNLVSAALRHVRDAEHLLGTSPDQAFHLAGFGPECARKATLTHAWFDRAIGHGMGESVDTLLEKLARLDFSEDPVGGGAEPRTEKALRSLLKQIRDQDKPDYILLDSRTGFNDVAGLSLYGLAHVAVLLSRVSEQGLLGLELTVRLLSSPQLRCAVVHCMAPPTRGSEADRLEQERFRERAYGIFLEHVYKKYFEDEEIPGVGASDQPHSPLVLHYEEALRTISELLPVHEQLLGEDYRRLVSRVQELCSPEEGPE